MEKLVKALLMGSACNLAAAAVGNLPDTLTPDPEIKDQKLRDTNVMAVREVEIYYDWLLRAWNSDGANDAFKDPKLPTLAPGPDVAASVLAQFGPLLQQLIAAIPAPKPALPATGPATLPAPGEAK